MYAWQYLGIVLLVLAGFILHQILRRILRFVIQRVTQTSFGQTYISKDLYWKIATALSWVAVIKLVTILLPILQLPIRFSHYLMKGLNILATVFLVILALRLIDLFISYFNRFTKLTDSTLDDQLSPLLAKLLKVVVVIIGGIYVLNALNVNVTALIAGISIGGLAVALAAQDTVKHLFGSVMIFVDRPFQIGDWINFKGIDGTVEEIGFRSTRIRTFAHSVTSVPNAELANAVIDNMGMRKYRRLKFLIGITYDTHPDLIEQYIDGLRELIVKHPDTREEYCKVYLHNFASSAIEILFYTFLDVPDGTYESRAKHEIMLAILQLSRALNVRLAFPTSTIFVEEFPGSGSLTPTYESAQKNATSQKMNQKVQDFVQTWQQNRHYNHDVSDQNMEEEVG